jgi:tetratricopeptide (TPR) repeat protein
VTLPQHLAHLQTVGLIDRVAVSDEAEFTFRHALIQDAAYGSLLRQQRAAWHRSAAECLEALYHSGNTPIPESLAPVLAHHYAAASLPERALYFYGQAGEAAFARYANIEASVLFERAVSLAVQTTTSDPAELRRLFARLGRSLELSSQPVAALQVYDRMEAVAQQRGDQVLLLSALMARATMLSTASLVHDDAGAQAALERASALARTLDDPAAEVQINWTLLLRNVMAGGDPDERLALGEAALQSARALGLRDQLAYVLTDLWYAYAGLGRWDQSERVLNEAQTLLRTLGNPALLSEALARLAINHLVAGNFSGALNRVAEAYAVAEQMDSPHMRGLSRVYAGQVHLQRGELATAIEVMREVIALGEQTGNITALIGTRADLAHAYGFLGDLETGLALGFQAIEAGRSRFALLMPWPLAVTARLLIQHGRLAEADALLSSLSFEALRRQIGFMVSLWIHVGLAQVELALARGHPAEALSHATRLLHALDASQVAYLRPEALRLRAHSHLRLRAVDLAQADLQAALALSQAHGARRDQWSILADLSDVEALCGHLEAAERLRLSARREVQWLAAQAPAALQGSYLARPPVAALLASPNPGRSDP